MKSDIEIAQAAKLEKISSVADKLDIPQDSLEHMVIIKLKSQWISSNRLSQRKMVN